MEELYHIERGFTQGMAFYRYYKKDVVTCYKEEIYPDNNRVTIEATYNLHAHALRLDSVLLYGNDSTILDFKRVNK